jgi:hypothetical protein
MDEKTQKNHATRRALEMAIARVQQLEQWMARNCTHCEREQAHLNQGSREQAYWNYGYLVALRDTLRLISDAA